VPSPWPDALEISIGGVLGPSYWVTWDPQLRALRYRSDEGRAGEASAETLVRPDDAAWERFWAAIDGLDAWTWLDRYEDAEATDGTGWYVRLEHGGRRLISSGMNAYPGGGGAGEPGRDFLRLCAEVSTLVGRRRFR
jgi:hypothetical protein